MTRALRWAVLITVTASAVCPYHNAEACSLTVSITFPAANARFKQGVPVIVKGTVTGAVNPTTISIKVDGSLKGTCSADASGNWKYVSWDTGGSSRGNHTILAEAQDSQGKTGSASRTISLFKMIWPISGTVTQEFGGGHNGIDIDCENGDDIGAAESGTVSSQYYEEGGYGYWRDINHSSMYVELLDASTTSYRSATVHSRYAHLLSNSGNPAGGSSLGQGAFVGDGDCTGQSTCSHLHFEVLEGSTKVNPRNYLP